MPYSKEEQYEWTHIAVSWDVNNRALKVYKNGKLAGEAEKGDRPWYSFAWDQGGYNTGHPLTILTQDHGKKNITMRDEFYIYNRPLSAAEILENKKLAK